MHPTSVVSLFETNKVERGSFVTQVLDAVKEGTTNPLQLQLQIRCMEDIIKQITADPIYKEMLLTEAQKYGKSFDFHSSKVEVKEAGTKYDYAACGDPVMSQLKQLAEEAGAAVKERENFLKGVPVEGMDVRIDDELVTIHRPIKTSTTTVAITLK